MQLQSQFVRPIMTRRNTSRKKKLPETPYMRAVVMDIETVVLRLSDISEVVEVELRKASGGELSVHFYRGSSNFTSRLFELLKLSKTLIYREHIQFRKCNTDEPRT